MLRTGLKIIVGLLVLLMIMVAGIIALLATAPQRALTLSSAVTGYHISSESLQLGWSPLRLEAERLQVDAPNGQVLFSGNELYLELDPLPAWQARGQFWAVKVNKAQLHLANVPSSDSEQTDNSLAGALDFTRILALNQLQIGELLVIDRNGQTRFTAHVSRQAAGQLQLSASMDERLNLQARLDHQRRIGRDQLDIQIEQLDLRSLIGESAATTEPDQLAQSEAPLNWQWLGLVRDLDIKLSLGELLLAEQTLSNIELVAGFATDQIEVKNLRVDFHQTPQTEQAEALTLTDLQASAKLQLLDLSTVGPDARGSVSVSAADTELRAEGTFNLNGLEGSELQISAKLDQNASVAGLLPAQAQAYLPADINTHFSAGDGLSVAFSELSAQLGSSDLRGTLQLQANAKLPSIRADLHSRQLVIGHSESTDKDTEQTAVSPTPSALGAADASTEVETDSEEDSESKSESNSESKKSKPERLFSEQPIDWQMLQQAELNITLRAETLQLYSAAFNDFDLQLAADDGRLRLEPFTAQFGGGGFNGTMTLESGEKNATANAAFRLSGVDLEAFGLVSQEQLRGGKTLIDIALESNGNSAAEFAASANGAVHVLVHDAVVQNDSIEIIGSDLLVETLNKLNPFAKSDPTTQLHCALVHFDIEDGVMNSDKALVLETDKMEIIGDGKINLDSEKIDIGITPNAKQGIGLNVGTVVKFMKVGGTLLAPSPAVDAGGLLKSGATVGAAMSTGGLSILAENLVKKVSGKNACRKALSEISVDQ